MTRPTHESAVMRADVNCDAIDAALAAERAAFAKAGLSSITGSDGEGNCPVRYSSQAVVLLNRSAHPSALLSTALARAERAQAFARVFEQFPGVEGDVEAAAFTLARMVEEVVDVLRATLEHDGIMRAPVSTAPST